MAALRAAWTAESVRLASVAPVVCPAVDPVFVVCGAVSNGGGGGDGRTICIQYLSELQRAKVPFAHLYW